MHSLKAKMYPAVLSFMPIFRLATKIMIKATGLLYTY